MAEGRTKELEEPVGLMEPIQELPTMGVGESGGADGDSNGESLIIHATHLIYRTFSSQPHLVPAEFGWTITSSSPVPETSHVCGQGCSPDALATIGLNKEAVLRLISNVAEPDPGKAETALLCSSIIFTL